MNLDEFLLKYGVVLARRASIKDKQRVLSAIIQDFGPLGYEVKGVTQKKRFMTSLNIHIGNLQKAKTVIVAPYDQPSKRFFTRGYHPFREVDPLWVKLISDNVITGSLAVAGILSILMLGPINPTAAVVVLGVLTVLMVLVTLIMPQGILNMANANRSNSGLYVMWGLAQRLKGAPEVAFVLLDHTTLNRHGELMLSTLLGTRRVPAQVIYLDCVGVGETVLISSDANNQHWAKRLAAAVNGLNAQTKTHDHQTMASSALSRFPTSLGVSTGHLIGKQFVIEHVRTSGDVEIREETVNAVVDALATLV
jgi:hypothetical protein